MPGTRRRCPVKLLAFNVPTSVVVKWLNFRQAGRGYRLADGQSVVLSGWTADGARVSIPLSREIRFRALRTHVTVEARIAREVLARLGRAADFIDRG